MTEYLTEQEQIEILKNWIKQYSLVIITGVVLAFIVISGWRYWQERQARILNHASSIYDELLMQRAQNDTTNTVVQAKKLFTHYPKTTYSQMAALLLARDAVNQKKYAEAEDRFNWVMSHSGIPAFRQIARLRLARLKLAQQKPTEAIQLLQTVDDKNFIGLIDEIKGDAYLSMNDNNKARLAYQQALNELPNAEIIRPLLQMKYDSLATVK